MILSTHAIVGGALASLLPSHPVAAFAVGFASHFAIDAIPHWDYPLRSISLAPGTRNSLRPSPALLRDLALIACDGLIGLAIVLGVFATSSTWLTIAAGAIGGMLPDPLQFLHSLHPHGPLKLYKRFHSWAHTRHSLKWPLGVSSQIAFAAAVAAASLAIR